MPQKHFPWSLVFCTAGAIGLAAGQWFILGLSNLGMGEGLMM